MSPCICSPHRGDEPYHTCSASAEYGNECGAEVNQAWVGVLNNKFQAYTNYNTSKLMLDCPHAKEQLAVCHFLSQISTCLHGNQIRGFVSSYVCHLVLRNT